MTPDSSSQREFWAALGAGNLAEVRRLIATGAAINLPIGTPGGETPLIRAVTASDLPMVRLLIELGADVNQRWNGPKSWTPLMFAHDNPEILQVLINAGAALEARATGDWIKLPSGRVTPRAGGQTTLHLAAVESNAGAIRTLLRAGAEVEARDEEGRAPLDYALRLGAISEAVEALVEGGAELTPERLEAMHSSAHDPESDLVNFPIAIDAAAAQTLTKDTPPGGDAEHPSQPVLQPTEYRCPNCHALIYSRKPKFCGQCGAKLPPELLLTELQAQAVTDERAWARELAKKFETHHDSTDHSRISLGAGTKTASVESVLRRISCVEEFRTRRRPAFGLYVVGYALTFFIMWFIPFKLNIIGAETLLLVPIGFILLCWRAWHYCSPICPNCKQNIRICSAVYCHGCGKPLRNQRCDDCSVDNSWISIFRPYSNTSWITFCPGCGARLEAKMPRWRAGQSGP